MPENRVIRGLLAILCTGLGVVGGALLLKFLLPPLLPFLLAAALAAGLEKPVSALVRRTKIPRTIAAGLLTAASAGILLSLCIGIIWLLLRGLSAVWSALPGLLASLPQASTRLQGVFARLVTAMPPEYQRGVNAYLAALPDRLSAAVSDFIAGIGSTLTGSIGSAAKIALFCITWFLAAYYLCACREQISAWIARHFPHRHTSTRRELHSAFKICIRFCLAQLLLSAVAFVLLAIGLLLLRCRWALLLSAAIALIDLLPVLGAGTVLVPWGLWAILSDDFVRGTGLLLLSVIVSASRNLLSPRIVGRGTGLPPLAALGVMYPGYLFFGVPGLLLAPLAAAVLLPLLRRGLWQKWRAFWRV